MALSIFYFRCHAGFSQPGLGPPTFPLVPAGLLPPPRPPPPPPLLSITAMSAGRGLLAGRSHTTLNPSYATTLRSFAINAMSDLLWP